MIVTLKKTFKFQFWKKVKGSDSKRQYKEDQWIIQLDISYPNGLNLHLSDFGCLFQLLFNNKLSNITCSFHYQ